MEDFIKDPNPFCIQIVEGYIIQTTPSDSESCLAPDQFWQLLHMSISRR